MFYSPFPPVMIINYNYYTLIICIQICAYSLVSVLIGPMFQIINLNVLNARCCPPVKREKSIPTQPRPAVGTSNASPTLRRRSGGPAHQRAGARLNTATAGACSSEGDVSTASARPNPTERIVETPARNMLSRLLVLEVIVRAAAAASPRRPSWASVRTVSSNTSSASTPPTAWICLEPAAGAAPPPCLRICSSAPRLGTILWR